MGEQHSPHWKETRTTLSKAFPQLYELEPDGPLALDLGDEGWLLEIKPEGKLLCRRAEGKISPATASHMVHTASLRLAYAANR